MSNCEPAFIREPIRSYLFSYDGPTLDLYNLDYDMFKNKHDCYRWSDFRAAYFMVDIPLDTVKEFYCLWRDQSEYFMIDGLNQSDVPVTSVFVKAAKRGNDVYKMFMEEKFSLIDSLPPIHFFCEDWGTKQTPMLFITLTVDPKRYSIDDAYSDISVQTNRFDTLLRQKYGVYKCNKCRTTFQGIKKCPKCNAARSHITCIGSFVKFRVWEVHENGYPHCHVIYYFHKTKFNVFEHFNKVKDSGKKQKRSFRIANKHRDAIRHMWPMGHVDIQGVSDTLGAFSEVKKYITKNIWSKKADLTNAMLTLYRKQAYWISSCDYNKQVDKLELSGSIEQRSNTIMEHIDDWIKKDFIGSIWGTAAYIDYYKGKQRLKEPSGSDLVKETLSNYNIEDDEIVKWRFNGFISGHDLSQFITNFDDGFVYEIKKPPPDLFYFINCEADQLIELIDDSYKRSD